MLRDYKVRGKVYSEIGYRKKLSNKLLMLKRNI